MTPLEINSNRINQLIDSQLTEWETARRNYRALESVRVKELMLGNCPVKVQFNPARIVSSAAKVDARSLKERPCFLCAGNRPAEQQGLADGDYTWLVNPFPIFPRHLTIPDNRHTPQLIGGRVGDLLRLTREADEFVLFYNGPRCGASAPDHAHFQAGNKGFLPLGGAIRSCRREPLLTHGSARLSFVTEYICPLFLIEAREADKARVLFDTLYRVLDQPAGEPEPMLNLVAWYEAGGVAPLHLPSHPAPPLVLSGRGRRQYPAQSRLGRLGRGLHHPPRKRFRENRGRGPATNPRGGLPQPGAN